MAAYLLINSSLLLALGFVGDMSKVLIMQQQTFVSVFLLVSDKKLMQRGSVYVRGG